MRIKYIIPWPLGPDRLESLRAATPIGLLNDDTEIEFCAVRNSGAFVDSYYEDLIFEMYVVEAGLTAEDDGFDAVIMDTVSDSGMYALRSRLSIPVIGPGQVAFAVAQILGHKFSIITLWDRWVHHYDKVLKAYGLTEHCASVRAANLEPDLTANDAHALFGIKGPEAIERLVLEAQRAISDDGADVILLGSTTMFDVAAALKARLPVPVIDPGPLAVKITEALVSLGLKHSKTAFPSPLRLQDEKFAALTDFEGTS